MDFMQIFLRAYIAAYVKSSLLDFSSAKLKFYSCFGNPKLPKFDDLGLYSHFKILAWVPFQNLVPFGLPCSTGPILHQTSGQLYYSFTVANESINEPQLKRRALELRPNFGLIANFFGGKSSRTTVYICILGQWVLSFFFCNGIFESFLAWLGQNEGCMWLCPNCPKTCSNQLCKADNSR